MTRRTSKLTLAVAAALGSLAVGSAHAVPQPYTDFGAFDDGLAAAGLTSVLHDFDDATADGTSIEGAKIDGITFSNFSLQASGAIPIVSDVSSVAPGNTRSSPNAIGTSNSGTSQKFENGATFTMGLPSTFAVGAWFLTTAPYDSVIQAGDFSLTIPGRTPSADNADLEPPELVQFNGGAGAGGVDGYFVGIIDTVPFDTVNVSSFFTSPGGGLFQFRLDDVYTAQAPVPTTFALLALGAGLFGFQRRRRAGL